MDARLWDVADYVIPPQVDTIPISILENALTSTFPLPPNDLMFPQGDDSFFVLTNVVITPNQTQSRCPAVSDWVIIPLCGVIINDLWWILSFDLQ